MARRARRLVRELTTEDDRQRVERFADELDEEATRLEAGKD